MYETYLQNEREWEEKFGFLLQPIKVTPYHGMDIDKAKIMQEVYNNLPEEIKSHNRLSLIKVMKALEKELKINQEDARKYPLITDGKQDDRYNAGYENALQLAIDKINNFINKIQ